MNSRRTMVLVMMATAVMLAVPLGIATFVPDADESGGTLAAETVSESGMTIEKVNGGWKLTGSITGAVQFSWAISEDGMATWNVVGTGPSLTLNASDYPDGTYWAMLTAASGKGAIVGMAVDSFTVSGSSAESVTPIIPGAAISIEKTDDGWKLNGSGTDAAVFYWYVLKDGTELWNNVGAGPTVTLKASDYSEGRYWVMLTTGSETGHTATAIDGFTVGGGQHDGIVDKVLSFLKEHPLAVIGAIVALVVLILVARWFL